MEVLAEYDVAEAGEKGALMRREGPCSSHVVEWRRAREAGALKGLTAQQRCAPARLVAVSSPSWPTASAITRSTACRCPRSKGSAGRSSKQVENERLRRDNERLCRDNERLVRELAKTRAALDVVGKARALGAPFCSNSSATPITTPWTRAPYSGEMLEGIPTEAFVKTPPFC